MASAHEDRYKRVLLYLDKLHSFVVSHLRRTVVVAAGGELVLAVSDNVGVEEVCQDGQQTAPVPVVSDSTSIVALPGHVGDGVERDVLILVNKHLRNEGMNHGFLDIHPGL